MIIKILSIATFISAIVSIYYKQTGYIKLFSIFKPLTTILIIITSIIIYKKNKNAYSKFIIIALLLSLIGDIFLIDNKYFIYGLFSFMLAHIIYTIAFTKISGFNFNFFILMILLIIGILYFLLIKKYLNNLLIPVILYISIILIMSWQAIALYQTNRSIIFLGIAAGSILFLISDAILAYNIFVTPLLYAKILILSTYWSAIYLFTIVGSYIKINKNSSFH